jgi:glucan 1,3-beta-glucosidase
MGTGSFFEDASNPQVMVRFGNPGDTGTMEISDFLFTVRGPTAGAVLVEWNVQQSSQGVAAMWDCHFRVGGAIGSNLQLADCPKLSGKINPNCKAASLLFHVTQYASGYFENVWAWVADHDIDEPASGNNTGGAQIDIYTARGVLIESSSGPIWLYGTAAEHSAFYQYQFAGASNVYSGHMQTETPYWQPSPGPFDVFTPGAFPNDPDYSNCGPDPTCKAAWALRILNTTNILIYGAGFYNFFDVSTTTLSEPSQVNNCTS